MIASVTSPQAILLRPHFTRSVVFMSFLSTCLEVQSATRFGDYIATQQNKSLTCGYFLTYSTSLSLKNSEITVSGR